MHERRLRLRTTDQHAVPTRNHLHLRLRPRVLANALQVATIDRSTMPDNVIGDGSAATGTLRLAGTLDAQRWEIRSADDATESSSSLSVNVEDHFNSSYSRPTVELRSTWDLSATGVGDHGVLLYGLAPGEIAAVHGCDLKGNPREPYRPTSGSTSQPSENNNPPTTRATSSIAGSGQGCRSGAVRTFDVWGTVRVTVDHFAAGVLDGRLLLARGDPRGRCPSPLRVFNFLSLEDVVHGGQVVDC